MKWLPLSTPFFDGVQSHLPRAVLNGLSQSTIRGRVPHEGIRW